MKKLLLTFTVIALSINIQAQDFEKAWALLNRNKVDSAEQLLKPSIISKKATFDEFLTYMLIKQYKDQTKEIVDFNHYYQKENNGHPYVFALWFSEPVVGNYGFKQEFQKEFLKRLISENPGNGSIKAAAHYSLGHYFVNIKKFDEALKENEKMGAIMNWQFTGPFDNVSGSGFNKTYDALKHPENTHEFISKTKAKVKWFTPASQCKDGWIFPGYFLPKESNAVNFAQTFVKSPVEQDVFIRAGGAGSIKVWVNDKLQISEPEERVTELDAYASKCHLNEGYNRIVIQIGYSENSSANFIIRVTDKNANPIQGLETSPSAKPYKPSQNKELAERLDFEPEKFFKDKIAANPKNLLNYVLLNQTYLRNKKVAEGRKAIEAGLAIAPENPLLNWELLQAFIKESNRTGISELINWFKTNSPESVIYYSVKVQELTDEKKYNEALTLLNEQIRLFGIDEGSLDTKINLISSLKDYPVLYATIDSAVKMFPRSSKFAEYKFNVTKYAEKNPSKAVKYLDSFLQKKYDYGLSQTLAKEYFAQNNPKKAYAILNEQVEIWPYDPTIRENLLKELYDNQKYSEAYLLSSKILDLSPYSGRYWQNKALIESVMQKKEEAYNSFQTAISFQPTLYLAREKQRIIKGLSPIYESIPAYNIDDLIKQNPLKSNSELNDYEYLISDNIHVIYPEGGRESFSTFAIRILGQKGLNDFKESQITFNSNTESLIIQEAQLIKPNGKKIKPEINDNQVVWTGIQVNDIIYIKYKKSYFIEGKLAPEFFDYFSVNVGEPILNLRYVVIMPDNKELSHVTKNGDFEPEISNIDKYKIYTWNKKNIEPVKEESFMPPYTDISLTVHLSTVKNWNEIAHWYSDLVYSKIENDYAVVELAKELFPDPSKLNSHQKAKIIYDYIADNMSYSSVAFRQGGMIPQKASTTINTRLGDCKDLSTLFMSIALQCNLKANLVLIDTRNNGLNDMVLPSFLFNHCIVQYEDEKGNVTNLELTDSNLPFRSLPYNLYNALSLVVPGKDETNQNFTLQKLNTQQKTKDKVISKADLIIKGSDVSYNCKTKEYGNRSTRIRNNYKDLSNEKAIKELEPSLNKKFASNTKLNSIKFEGLNLREDSISYDYVCSLPNRIQKIGSMSALKLPFYEEIATRQPFSNETREFEFEYWNYEDTDQYLNEVTVEIPAGMKFIEVPVNVVYTCPAGEYKMTYKKLSENKLLVTRSAQLNRENIKPSDYPNLRKFMNDIMDKEDAFIVFQ